MTSPENPDLPDGPPRVDELFNRALVAQLAEQRAQRETFAEVERKVEGLERVVTERLSDLARQLGTDGQLEARIELLEEMIGTRLASVERVVRTELDNRLGAMAERLHHVEQSLGGDDTGARLIALEATVKRRLGNLEEAVKLEDLTDRLSRMERTLGELAGVDPTTLDPNLGVKLDGIERAVADRLAGLEGLLRDNDLVRRLDSLESSVADRLSLLEDTVRSEEIGRRLKSLELALDERSGRIEEFVKTSDLERRIEALAQAVDEQLAELRISLSNGAQVVVGSDEAGSAPVSSLDSTVAARLAGLEGSLRRLQEDTTARLDDLRTASIASEAGILERIVAESHVVGAHFQAIRPVVEAAVAARPEIEQALAEVRSLANAARDVAADLMSGVAGPPAPPTEGEPSGPYRVEELQEAAAAPDDEPKIEEAEDSVFRPPEETPIPDRRFGLLPRRDR
jgi:CHASE3 domain sensor protein